MASATSSDTDYQLYRHTVEMFGRKFSIPLFCGEKLETLYEANGSRLRLLTQQYLSRIEWELRYRETNEGSNPRPHKVVKRTSLKITEGEEHGEEFKISAGFAGKGFSLGMEATRYRKSFSQEELGEEVETTDEYLIDPGETLRVYQKVYVFKCEHAFQFNIPGKTLYLSPDPLWRTDLAINSVEWISTPRELNGEGSMTVYDPPASTPLRPTLESVDGPDMFLLLLIAGDYAEKFPFNYNLAAMDRIAFAGSLRCQDAKSFGQASFSEDDRKRIEELLNRGKLV